MLRFRLIKIYLVCYFRDAMSVIVKLFFCSVSFVSSFVRSFSMCLSLRDIGFHAKKNFLDRKS